MLQYDRGNIHSNSHVTFSDTITIRIVNHVSDTLRKEGIAINKTVRKTIATELHRTGEKNFVRRVVCTKRVWWRDTVRLNEQRIQQSDHGNK